MLVVDSHVHAGVTWSEPVDVLLYEMEKNGVSHACLVQHNGNYDNSYLLDCMRKHEGKFKVVGLIDLNSPDQVAMLEDLHKQGGSGFRINLRKEDEWNPDKPAFKAAGDLGMIVSVIGHAENFAGAKFKTLLDNCPTTHFALEHLVRSPGGDVATGPLDVYEDALKCAEWPNTSVKVPGMGEILKKPARVPNSGFTWPKPPPHYALAKKSFGAARMTWGSNFPPCAAKEGYRNTLVGVRDTGIFTGDEIEMVMGKTAAKLWGFAQ